MHAGIVGISLTSSSKPSVGARKDGRVTFITTRKEDRQATSRLYLIKEVE